MVTPRDGEPAAGEPIEREQPLDVVAKLADHQRNLEPLPVASRAVLIALPRPLICSVVLPIHFWSRRLLWIEHLRRELGGGDGPLEAIDLEQDKRTLASVLADLEQRGITRLHVHGGRDQPGFARALVARWNGRLARVEDSSPAHASLLAPWLDREPPQPPSSPTDITVVDEPPDDLRRIVIAPDPDRAFAPWSGFLQPGAGARRRAQWVDWWRRKGAPDAIRCAELGLDPFLEERLREPPTASPRPRAVFLAVAGLDGAGKSTHAQALASSLASEGRRATVVKIYRHGAFLELANELGARTRRGAPLAAFRVSRLVKLVDSLRVLRDAILPLAEKSDALIFDRYLETHVAAAASQLEWKLEGHAFLAAFPPAEHTFWLRLQEKTALERLRARADALSADEHEVGLRGYSREYDRLSSGPDHTSFDAAGSFEANASQLQSRSRELLAGLRRASSDSLRESRAPGSSLGSPPEAPLAAPRTARCLVTVGAHGDVELGRDLLDLRRFLDERLGPAIGGVPESAWLEAWCAELVLDVRVLRPQRASVALWPEALARMRPNHDLGMLPELARLLDAEVDGTFDRAAIARGDDAIAIETFRALLGTSEAGARRLASEYVVALKSCAAEG